jgi:hypothetical protein
MMNAFLRLLPYTDPRSWRQPAYGIRYPVLASEAGRKGGEHGPAIADHSRPR